MHLHLDAAIGFALGLAVCYMMFRSMGVFAFLLFLGLCQSALAVTAPDPASPSVVILSPTPGDDVSASVMMGFGFGLTVCGFGWVLRTAKKVTVGYD